MNMQAWFLTLFLLLINLFCGYSQVSDSLFKASSQNENLVILDEVMSVIITGEKAPYMNFTIQNATKYIIQNEVGLNEIKETQLPKRFDEMYICHAPTIRNVDWVFENIRVKHFNASIEKSGQEIQLEVEAFVSQKRIINTKGFFGKIDVYNYQINNLSVGDTLLVNYEYQVDFKDNWIRLLSNRVFFHGKYPKKSFKLSWCYNIDMEVDSQFVNLQEPLVFVKGKTICYNWEMNNLPGVLDEQNARPYKELPYFVFVPKPYDFEYTHFDSYKLEFIPIYFYLANKRQSELNIEMWDNVIGNKNKNNLYYGKVAKKIIAKEPTDSIGNSHLTYFQQYIVDSVNYKNDFKYYNYEEQSIRQRAGVDLYGYSMNDHNLERLYGNMVPRFAKDLLTAYPVDKRVGEISHAYCSTMQTNDLIYTVIFNNGSAGFVIPKSDKNNYYFNELPFYYENIPVLLMHVYDYANPSFIYAEDYDFTTAFYPYDYGSGKRNYNTAYRETITPAGVYNDNYRKTQSLVNINLEKKHAEFKTRVILSGQYSTLTRNVYLGKTVDSTINPKYLEPVWNISEGVQMKATKTEDQLIYYPFRSSINLSYTADDILVLENDQFELKPYKWFKFIYNDSNENEIRFLDYYPDFVGSDQYSYLIEFNEPIKLIGGDLKHGLNNEYAYLNFELTQVEENKILVVCNYNVKSTLVKQEDYSLVKEINKAISSLKNQKIIFELKD